MTNNPKVDELQCPSTYAVPKTSVRRHTLNLDGSELNYETTSGYITVSEESSEDSRYMGFQPKADVFVTSYCKVDKGSGEKDPSRPVIFAFNGGPGSSSVWLHLGLFGPRRVVENDYGALAQPPYGVVDNFETSLEYADLVFIDPVTTGYSRVTEGTKTDAFHGYSADRDLVGETIRLWLVQNNRWLSPKFLAGESYGTTRAAALAGYLAKRHGIALNGVLLISAVLDFATIQFEEGNEAPFVHYLPTFAATAHFHGKHPNSSLEEVAKKAFEFANGDYLLALHAGNQLTADEFNETAAKISDLIGLDVELVKQLNLRVDDETYFNEFLKPDGMKLGRLDTRFSAPRGPVGSEVLGDDPAYAIIQYPYTAVANHFFRSELGFESDLVYEIISPRVRPWSYKEFENKYVNSAGALSFAMRMNPYLKVYVAFGYHDAATPFSGSEYVLSHLHISKELESNIVREYYPAGHMMYVHQDSRVKQLADIRSFVLSAV